MFTRGPQSSIKHKQVAESCGGAVVGASGVYREGWTARGDCTTVHPCLARPLGLSETKRRSGPGGRGDTSWASLADTKQSIEM